MKEFELDPEEKEILEAFDRGELKPVADRDHEIARHREYARNTAQRPTRQHPHLIERPGRPPGAGCRTRHPLPDADVEHSASLCQW